MELFKDLVQDNIYKHILPTFSQVLRRQSPTENEILYSICIFDTYIDLSSKDKFDAIWKELMPFLLKHCQGDDNLDIL